MKKMPKPELIVMLTWHDYTVENALNVFEQCHDSDAMYWGIKEHSLPATQMKQLFDRMKCCGKTTILEVVAYTEQEGLAGAELAVQCGCDILLGTKFYDSINLFCQEHNLKYMPFVGEISGRPSVLCGDADTLIQEAQNYIKKGVYGINLLGYRYTGDATALNKKFLQHIDAPVCLAGSINSYERLDEIKEVQPWAFTIGSAFFEKKFGDTMSEQINRVYNYIKEEN